MSQELLIILFTFFSGFIVLALLIHYWLKKQEEKFQADKLMTSFLKSFETRSLEQRQDLREQSRMLNERLDNAARVISGLQKHIGEFSEIGRGMKDLQDFLKNPKLRGNLGEEVLADLLKQIFPVSQFALQYQFKNGARVDAIIKTDAGILPIDAKFPLENFQKINTSQSELQKDQAQKEFIRDVRSHIEAISKRYILPNEGTVDFAMMYVPSESVFYEMVQLQSLMTYAKKLRVYPVSPTTLYAHLQTILLSFRGKQMEQKTKEVFAILRTLILEYGKVDENLQLLGKHLTNAYTQMGNMQQEFGRLGKTLKSTQSLEVEAPSELSS